MLYHGRMRPSIKGALVMLAVLVVAALAGTLVFVKATGLSARDTPGSIETFVARGLRAWAIPADYDERINPVRGNEESIRNGMAHFADHCATCHANDGSGNTAMGKGMFPPAPDMRARATQDLSDGTLFYIIEHGIRFTGMPSWGTGASEEEELTWHLVNFIRHLPKLTPEELETMAAMNPRPPAEVRRELEEERFLRGDDPPPAEPAPSRR
jgi:mono/diheme cytochrome c family protein